MLDISETARYDARRFRLGGPTVFRPRDHSGVFARGGVPSEGRGRGHRGTCGPSLVEGTTGAGPESACGARPLSWVMAAIESHPRRGIHCGQNRGSFKRCVLTGNSTESRDVQPT